MLGAEVYDEVVGEDEASAAERQALGRVEHGVDARVRAVIDVQPAGEGHRAAAQVEAVDRLAPGAGEEAEQINHGGSARRARPGYGSRRWRRWPPSAGRGTARRSVC